MMVHNNSKIFNCNICHRSYSTKGNLNLHMRVHDDLKGFKCNICFKNFQSQNDIKKHYRIHTGEKPFSCQICDKKFVQKIQLIQHEATHSKIKSFKCSICPEGRFFKTKKGLKEHMVFHFEPKYSCSHCDYKTHTKSNLTRHEKSHIKK